MPAPLPIMAMRSIASRGACFHREVIVDDGRNLARQRLGAEVGGVIEQPLGDLADRAVAGQRQIVGLEIIGDQLLGAGRILIGERGGERGDRALAVGALAPGKPRQKRVEGRRAPEIVTQLEPPALWQRERIEQSVEQRDVAEAEVELLQPGAPHRLGDEQHDLGVGAVAVGDAETFDAGLAELARMGAARALRLKAEGRAVIAIAGLDIGARVTLEIEPRHRHGEVWPETQLGAGEIGEDVGAAPDRLADLVEQDVSRLDDRRRNLLVATFAKHFEQGGGLGFERLEFSRQIPRPWLTPCDGRGRPARP